MVPAGTVVLQAGAQALALEQGLLGPASPIPTQCLLLKNMFNPAECGPHPSPPALPLPAQQGELGEGAGAVGSWISKLCCNRDMFELSSMAFLYVTVARALCFCCSGTHCWP